MGDEHFNVVPQDYRDHRPLALSGLDLWENNGWMIWNRDGDQNLLAWFSPYRLIGRAPGSVFSVDDVGLSQSLLLCGDFDGQRRSRMENDPFLNVGYDLGDHIPGAAIETSVSERMAVWRVGKREYGAAPPHWWVRGEHAGISVDLELDAMSPATWLTDRAMSMEQIEERWHLVCARARGTIAYRGKTFAIDGFGCHERHVHCGTRYNPIKTLSSRGVTWHSCGHDEKQVLLFSRPSLGLFWGKVVLDGEIHNFDTPSHNCRIDETDFWIDPESRLQVPCAWDSKFVGPSGTLHVSARAFSRAYYLWPNFKYGTTILYWWIGEADVRCSLTDGREFAWSKIQYIVHDNRLLYRQHRGD